MVRLEPELRSIHIQRKIMMDLREGVVRTLLGHCWA